MKRGVDVAKSIGRVTVIHHNIRHKKVKNYVRSEAMVFIPLEGHLDVTTKQHGTFRCRVGDAVVLPPDMPHGLYSSERSGERLILLIPPDLLYSKKEMKSAKVPCRVVYTRLMHELIFCLLNDRVQFEMHNQTLKLLLLHLRDVARQSENQQLLPHLSMVAIDLRLRKAVLYIEDNFSENPNVETIAKVSGLSVRNLSRLFKSELGTTPRNCLNAYRMNRAFELLNAGRMTVAEVCGELNFASLPQFSNDFKKRFGQNPGSLTQSAKKRLS